MSGNRITKIKIHKLGSDIGWKVKFKYEGKDFILFTSEYELEDSCSHHVMLRLAEIDGDNTPKILEDSFRDDVNLEHYILDYKETRPLSHYYFDQFYVGLPETFKISLKRRIENEK